MMQLAREIAFEHCFIVSKFGPHAEQAKVAETILRKGSYDEEALRTLRAIKSSAPALIEAVGKEAAASILC